MKSFLAATVFFSGAVVFYFLFIPAVRGRSWENRIDSEWLDFQEKFLEIIGNPDTPLQELLDWLPVARWADEHFSPLYGQVRIFERHIRAVLYEAHGLSLPRV